MELTDSFEWQGRTIACGRAGTGPDVVFCHGTPFSSYVWSRFADALSNDFTVHLWDMPGYGQSSKLPEHPVDFGSQATAFAAVLEHWQLDRPHVVAHDFGGAVSLRATLVEHALRVVDVGRRRGHCAERLAVLPLRPASPRRPRRLPPYIHEAMLRAYIQGASGVGRRESDLAALLDPWTGALGQPAFYRQIVQYDEDFLHDNEQRLDQLSMPVSVVWGADDAWIPPQTGRPLAELIRGSVYTEIADAGHLVRFDAPVALSDAVRRWVVEHAR